jgi:prepilin-type N-terminal cleavage/methylation domain-containing protein/prepilin-type processing-associated H-X9-DG protein
MNTKRAFTLIELLVVIAIIALLMSILMPALAKVRVQALSVACIARVNQWGSIISAYTEDNNGNFNCRKAADPAFWGKMWPHTFRPYYKDPRMRCCPAAENGALHEGPNATWGGTNYESGKHGAWVPSQYPIKEEKKEAPHYYFGSYGMNRNVEDHIATEYDTGLWRRLEVKGGADVPVFFDCTYVLTWGSTNADPPPFNGAWDNEMCLVCIDRHGGGFVNMLFMDLSSRQCPLKKLYTLKWRRTSNTCVKEWTICGCGGGPKGRDACIENWNDAARVGQQKSWMSDMPVF